MKARASIESHGVSMKFTQEDTSVKVSGRRSLRTMLLMNAGDD